MQTGEPDLINPDHDWRLRRREPLQVKSEPVANRTNLHSCQIEDGDDVRTPENWPTIMQAMTRARETSSQIVTGHVQKWAGYS